MKSRNTTHRVVGLAAFCCLLLLALVTCAAAPETSQLASEPAVSADVPAAQEGTAAPSSTAAETLTSPPAVPPATATDQQIPHKGIDVSHFSGAVDWAQVHAAGFTFAYVKATEGVDGKDPLFDDHWRDLGGVGIQRGAYHFYVTEDDPEEQARFFIETAKLEPGDLVPVVDIELIGHGTQPGLADRFLRWLEIVEDHFGVKPIIYTTPNFWDQHLTDTFGDYPLWIAEYGVEAPRIPKGWTTWWLWQWQGDATVPGVEKTADISRINHQHITLTHLQTGATSADDSIENDSP